MTELLAWAGEHWFLALVAIGGASLVLIVFASSLGSVGRTTLHQHVHHHHAETCDRDHEKGPCRKSE